MQLKNFLAAALCTADTRLRRGVRFFFHSIVVSLCLTSCGGWQDGEIFEYPYDGGVDPTLVTVNLIYHCCSDIPLYTTEHLTKVRSVGEIRRYNYEILSADTLFKKGTIERGVDDLSDVKLSVSLPSGEYKVVMWQDCIDKYGEPFYNTSSLDAVLIRDAESYVGCTDLKDASWNITELSIPHTDEWNVNIDYNVNLERPVSKITFLSTDGPIFMQRCTEYLRAKSSYSSTLAHDHVRERVSLRFTYEGYILSRFDATIGEFRNSALGYGFDGVLEETDKPTDLFIGSDYVFVNEDESVVWLKLTVIDNLDGSIIEQTDRIRVPLKKGEETVVTGDILTMYWGQGVSIDPQFSGEFDYNVD